MGESKRKAYGRKRKRSLWVKIKEKPTGENKREANGQKQKKSIWVKVNEKSMSNSKNTYRQDMKETI